MRIAMELQAGAARPSRDERTRAASFGPRKRRARVLVVARSSGLRSTLAAFVEQAGMLPVLAASLVDAAILQGLGRPIAKAIVAWPEEPVRVWRDQLRGLSEGMPLLLVGDHAPGRGFGDLFKRRQATSVAVLSDGADQFLKQCQDFLAVPQAEDEVISAPVQFEADVVHFPGVEFRPRSREIWVGGSRCVIGAAAFKLALHFFRNPERTVDWNEIALIVGMDGRTGSITQCRNAVARVRALLKSQGMPPYTLQSVRRQGYCLRAPDTVVAGHHGRHEELPVDSGLNTEVLERWRTLLIDLTRPIGAGGCTLGQPRSETGAMLLPRGLAS